MRKGTFIGVILFALLMVLGSISYAVANYVNFVPTDPREDIVFVGGLVEDVGELLLFVTFAEPVGDPGEFEYIEATVKPPGEPPCTPYQEWFWAEPTDWPEVWVAEAYLYEPPCEFEEDQPFGFAVYAKYAGLGPGTDRAPDSGHRSMVNTEGEVEVFVDPQETAVPTYPMEDIISVVFTAEEDYLGVSVELADEWDGNGELDVWVEVYAVNATTTNGEMYWIIEPYFFWEPGEWFEVFPPELDQVGGTSWYGELPHTLEMDGDIVTIEDYWLSVHAEYFGGHPEDAATPPDGHIDWDMLTYTLLDPEETAGPPGVVPEFMLATPAITSLGLGAYLLWRRRKPS